MKKLVLTVMLIAMASALFAQTPPPPPERNLTWTNYLWDSVSFERDVTAKTFSNEIDKAFTPGPKFGLYGQQFIYGGLGNPLELTSLSNDNEFNFGYYRPGTMPMSYYGKFKSTILDKAHRRSSSFTTTWNDPQHTQILSTTKTTYNRTPIFENYNGTFRFLVGIGKDKGMVTGLYFNMYGDNSKYKDIATPANTGKNFKKTVYTDKVNANNSYTESLLNVDYTSIPDIDSTNYTTGVAGKGEFTNQFSIGVPFALKTGAISHTANFDLSAYLKNKNAAYSKKSQTENITYSYTGYDSNVAITLNYGLALPVNDTEEDLWFGGARIGMDFRNSQYKYSYEHKEDGIKASASQTSLPKAGFALNLTGGRLFNFYSPKKAVSFKIRPALTLGLDTRMTDTGLDGYNKKVTATYSNSKAGAFQIKSASHTAIDKDGFHENTTIISTSLEVPMGLKVQPENWKIGLLLGADLSVNYSVTIESDSSGKYKQNNTTTTNITNGNGSTNNTSINNNTYPGPSSTSQAEVKDSSFDFNEQHYFGFTIPFEGGAHLDFVMVGGNLLNVTNFKIQAFIPLGAPKERVKTAAKEVKAKK